MQTVFNETEESVQCSVKIIADSINKFGQRITTFELEYPRFVHSELMTHRLFSRNSASSRAVPTVSVLDSIAKRIAMPVFWGKNQKGMQSYQELDSLQKSASKALWVEAAKQATSLSKIMQETGLHKQVANRITEPFTYMKVIVTATDFDSFFWLRTHHAADPTIRQLAVMMKDVYDNNKPELLHRGEWHLPYVDKRLIRDGALSTEDALKLSVSCCCQVSYRKQDQSPEKAQEIWDMLNIGSATEPEHSSPTEHQALCFEQSSPMTMYPHQWSIGVTHIDRNLDMWSGNFKGWIQYRQSLNQLKNFNNNLSLLERQPVLS